MEHPNKVDSDRVGAECAAAVFLRLLIEKGLQQADPKWLRIPEKSATQLPEDNFYVRSSMLPYLVNGVKERLDLDVSWLHTTDELSIADLELYALGMESKDVLLAKC